MLVARAILAADGLVFKRAAPMLATHDGITDLLDVGAVAVALRLGLLADRTEVASSPVAFGADVLLARRAVGLVVDDEGGGAVRAGHFGSCWATHLRSATLKSVFRTMPKTRSHRHRKHRQTRRRPRVAVKRMSSSVGMIEPVRIQPPMLVPRKGLQMKSKEETK